jgi:hypothetical protein
VVCQQEVSSSFASLVRPKAESRNDGKIDEARSISLWASLYITVHFWPGLILRRTGHLQTVLPLALTGLNFRVIGGKNFAFEKLCFTLPEGLALMKLGRVLRLAHVDPSYFSSTVVSATH